MCFSRRFPPPPGKIASPGPIFSVPPLPQREYSLKMVPPSALTNYNRPIKCPFAQWKKIFREGISPYEERKNLFSPSIILFSPSKIRREENKQGEVRRDSRLPFALHVASRERAPP